MEQVGICLGSSSISLYSPNREPLWTLHKGDPLTAFKEVISNLPSTVSIAVTGRKLRKHLKTAVLSEAEATEIAYQALRDKYGTFDGIVSAGGENFTLYKLNDNGSIATVFTGSKCASGTGEFFLHQLKRMEIDLSDLDRIKADGIYELSSRCTVFCKSDCTHALNRGIPKEIVLNGLGKVMADKILNLAKSADCRNVLLVGGTTKNHLMINHLKEYLDFVVPSEAVYFEALGAYHWLTRHNIAPVEKRVLLNVERKSTFETLPALKEYLSMVEFKEMDRGVAASGDRCVVGVDVGSTTTKAVLVRLKDKKILASCYLRTLGDPINASIKCYEAIEPQIPDGLEVVGIGITGSGRKIVGLHAKTRAVYNEIMAHARAAAFFDPEVDTIFEIGGQDAKYTFLNEGVPCDYAMNEACSAGTGSFLEESAKESLGVDYTEIANLALKGENPPNFSDQCAAFINSDIKTAIQEGISRENICAGLVYSICMNYLNRVKGNRPVGKKLFMQGGTCYNKAVPIAMACLTGKRIVVPPEPGLMGAYGVALIVMDNLQNGTLQQQRLTLRELINRKVKYLTPFTCPGGKSKCDRRCTITLIEIDGRKIPFGGSCNMYENIRLEKPIDAEDLDYTEQREKSVFSIPSVRSRSEPAQTVGINRSFTMNTLFPFFSTYFAELGFQVVLPEKPADSGKELLGAEFCFPAELSHRFLRSLIDMRPNYIFLPRIRGYRVENSENYNVFCPFVQSEPDWLQADLPEVKNFNLISPNLDFSAPREHLLSQMIELGKLLDTSPSTCQRAFLRAEKAQQAWEAHLKNSGKEFLKRVEEGKIGIVFFGRSYNAFTRHANLGIPKKVASYGYPVISFDALPFEDEKGYKNMYWSWGEMILKAARFVRKHPSLYPIYITNFSCGPDSFILSYFKEIMKGKPSLILELDSHTADTGVETRLEAFFDVIKYASASQDTRRYSKPLSVKINRKGVLITLENGETTDWSDSRVRVVFPTMGKLGVKFLAAAIEHKGIKTTVCPEIGEAEFKLGRGNSSSKECLPLQLTLGSLIRYLQNRPKDEITLYFMPSTSGPCRFGQYSVFMKLWLKENGIRNVGLLSLNSENAYGGLGLNFTLRAWVAVIVSDVFSDVLRALPALSSSEKDIKSMVESWETRITNSLRNDSLNDVLHTIDKIATEMSSLNLAKKFDSAPKVLLTGEIFVRWDEFSRKRLEDLFSSEGIVMHISPVHEWIYYTDCLFRKRLISPDSGALDQIKKILEIAVKRYFERRIKKSFARSGLYSFRMTRVDQIMKVASSFLNPVLTGEAILTIGTTLHEVLDYYDGVISIGPFGCMPSRISEAIIKSALHRVGKANAPFVALEADGNQFTPSIESKLDAFIVQVKKAYRRRTMS